MIESRLTHSDLTDLRAYVEHEAPFATILIPAPSDVADAEHRFDVRWRQARRELSDAWTTETMDRLDEQIAGLQHDSGAALVLVASADGAFLTEFLTAAPTRVRTMEGPLPSLVPIIEGRQRTIAHVVVEADKSGANLTAYDGATVVEQDEVVGEEFQIHRGAPGGWSQRRFQQRAENTWDTNANDVADRVAALADQIDARLVAVSGPVRGRSMVVKELSERNVGGVVEIEHGDADAVAEAIVTAVDDVHASAIADLGERYRDALSNDGAVAGVDDTFTALVEGRVDTLLVNDDWSDETTLRRQVDGIPDGARAIDAAIVAALRSDARIVVVPTLAAMDGPLGALTRW